MTVPKINTIKRGEARFYVHPADARKGPGVTSIVDMLPKPFLGPWNAKLTAETAVSNLGEIVGIAMRDRQGAIDFLKGAPRRDVQQAADKGSDAHDIFERMAKGEPPGRLHPEMRAYADRFAEWLDQFQPEFIFLEETVWSEAHDYAGSFDALAVIDGETVFLDWKTTRSGIHASVAIQLSAYRHADYLIRPDGSRVPLPVATGGAVLHVRPEGWTFPPVKCDREVFEYFLHLREIFRWEHEVRDTVVGKPLNKPKAEVTPRRATPRRSA